MLKRRIKRITIKNYRSIADLTVEMPDLMVLVGENGSGKSNFVDALRFLSETVRNADLGFAVDKRYGINLLKAKLNNQKISEISFDVLIEIENTLYRYFIVISSDDEGQYQVQDEVIEFDGKSIKRSETTFPTSLGLSSLSANPEIRPLYLFLRELSFSFISPRDIQLFEPLSKSTTLYEDGSNLASTLREIIHNEKNQHLERSILEYLSLILTDVNDFKVSEIVGGFVSIWLTHKNGKELLLAQESDGTKLVLSILTALHQPHTPSLLAIEEPENGIHPGALAMLCEIIEEASLRQQIIVTTHSPDLITHFDVNSIRVVERTDDGTKIDMIADNQLEAVNQKLFSTSDLLSMEGRLKRKQYDE
jgi:predicted ATPase